jgi:hypothetical protein
MDLEVLKSYLVSLGFQVNNPELRKFEMGLKDASAAVERNTGGVIRDLLKWQLAATGALVGVSTAVIGMAEQVADADQKYRLLGLHMFMNTAQARKLSMSLDALGVSMEDAIWDPEIRARMIEMGVLQDKLTAQLGVNFEANMRRVRDLKTEFAKLRMEFEYVSMAFVSNLVENLGPQIDWIIAKFHEWGDYIIQHIPEWSDSFSENIVPVLKTTWEVVKDLGMELGGLLVDFTNLIGILTGDQSIEGTELSFHKLAGAIQHVVHVLGGMLITLSHAARIVLDLAGAVLALLTLHPGDALMFAKSAFSLLGPDAGGLLGAALGTMIAPGIGTGIGAAIGAGLGGGAKLYNDSQKPGDDATAGPSAPSSDVAKRARELAIKAGAQLGVDPKLIYEQWQHETNGFNSSVMSKYNNMGGVKNAGGNGYRSFASLDDFSAYYTSMMQRNFSGVRGAKTEEEWVKGLQNGRLGGYFEDDPQKYLQGMKRWGAQDGGLFDSNGGGSNVTIGSVSVSIMQPNATPEQIQQHVTKGIADYAKAQRQTTQRNIAQLGYVG